MIDNKELLLKRLSIIKLLYKIGLEQSMQSETTASFSILSFHDSVEMFLKLGAEYKNKKADKLDFLQYWDIMPELTIKGNMHILNDRRKNLKHRGQWPAKIEIEASRVNTTDFFEQNTPIIFGMSFSDISLFELLKFTKTKELLISSQNALYKGEIMKCIEDVTISFYKLLAEYKDTKRGWGNRTNFDFIEKINSGRYDLSHNKNTDTSKRLEDVVDKINDNFVQIEKALEVISLGLDYRKYSKFKILTPIATKLSGGKYILEGYGEKNWNKENCQFLIDFVLESGLRLQDFDFEFENLDITKPTVTIRDI